MLTSSQVRKIINDKIKQISFLPQSSIQWFNQKDFKPPLTGVWCRFTIQYSPSQVACLMNGTIERDFGIINAQCFARKGVGDIELISIADKMREHWKGFNSSHFEVTLTNAPTEPYNELETDFVGCLVRVDFRVN